MENRAFFIYLITMALITYIIRMAPLVLIKKKIKNKCILSFLHYVPYTVLSVMTIPAIFYSTSGTLSATIGFIAALILAYRGKSLVKVAAAACLVVLLTEFILNMI